jgi:hypothetical protein
MTMKKRIPPITVLAILVALWQPAAAPALPEGFFGIVPQAEITQADADYMAAGGIESIRIPLIWSQVQPTETSGYDWSEVDETVTLAARSGLQVMPSLIGTPKWLEGKETTLPAGDALERRGWTAFVRAAAERYGRGGTFWLEHDAFSASPLPPLPIRTWQIWNEANFHYFAFPVSPGRYAKLVELAAPQVKAVDPGAKILLAGLFGKPPQGGRLGIPAAQFLAQLYRIPGFSSDFDGVALHPYAFRINMLARMVKGVHRVIVANHDRAPLYITEMGWGSQSDPNVNAFEQGLGGQETELTGAYRFLIANQVRLNLGGVYWFSWKDQRGSCTFCDSVGLFAEGLGFQPKPAWGAFVHQTGGRPSP